jgi:hypothetical protein
MRMSRRWLKNNAEPEEQAVSETEIPQTWAPASGKFDLPETCRQPFFHARFIGSVDRTARAP